MLRNRGNRKTVSMQPEEKTEGRRGKVEGRKSTLRVRQSGAAHLRGRRGSCESGDEAESSPGERRGEQASAPGRPPAGPSRQAARH